MIKECCICKKLKDISKFWTDRHIKKDGLKSCCISCAKDRYKEQYKKHKKRWLDQQNNFRLSNYEYWKKYHNEWARKYNLKLKNIVYNHYGNACNCCNENGRSFLVIDHINNDGNKDTYANGKRITGGAFYSRIIKEGFPKNKYQLLCANCNHSKLMCGGECEHQIIKNDINLESYMEEQSTKI